MDTLNNKKAVLSQYAKDEIKSALSKKQTNGVLSIPKEYGLFVCC